MISAFSFVSILLFTVVVSQPLFFLLALGRASNELSGAAYAELRQRINASITRPLTQLYVATLVSVLALLVIALFSQAFVLATGAAIGAGGLIADSVLAVRRNVPLNKQMDAWNTSALPADWAQLRARWSDAFAIRRVVLLVAYAALLGAVVFGRG